jgi:hypothetical protein
MGANKNEDEVEELLLETVNGLVEAAAGDVDEELASYVGSDRFDELAEKIPSFNEVTARTFRAAGVLGGGAGLVLRFPTGEEFQISIRRSR